MRTRAESNYDAHRGKPDHHCGPDRQWPHGYCAKFRGPHACTEVAGFIAKHGGCNWWVAAETERPARSSGGAAPPMLLADPSSSATTRATGGRVEVERQHYKLGGAAPSTQPQPYRDLATGGRANDSERTVRVYGLEIVLEHERGSTSRGVRIPFGYGHLRNVAGERVDVMLGPHLKSDKVFLVDQQNMRPAVAIGFGSAEQVRAHFVRAFPDNSGRRKLRGITEMSVGRFKSWLNGDAKPAVRAA
jgi:hypothetical protein